MKLSGLSEMALAGFLAHIPIWPSRATYLSNNRSDSRGDPTAAGRDPARERAPSLSAVPFLSGPVRPPVYFFWPNLLLPAWPVMRVISSFFSAQFTLMRMILCVKNYHLFWFFSTYLYMTLFTSATTLF